MTPGFAVPVVGWRSETRVPFPLPGRASEAKPPPSPLQPAPPGPTGPKAGAHSPSAPRFPAAGGRIHPRPGRSRPVRSQLPRLPGSAPRPLQRGRDTGRWTSRPKVSSEERGGAGRGGGRRGGKGPGEEGERSERLGGGGASRRGRLLSHRKPLGRLVAESRPQATNNKNNEVLPVSLYVCALCNILSFNSNNPIK